MKAIKFIIIFLGLKFNVIQYRWGRKLFGGKYYLISTTQLSMAPFWSDVEIKSCQSETLKIEIHPLNPTTHDRTK